MSGNPVTCQLYIKNLTLYFIAALKNKQLIYKIQGIKTESK